MKNKISAKDITIRALSIVFAIIIWFYVITEQNPVVNKEVVLPVKLINLDYLEKNNLVLNNSPDSFKITLKLKGKKNTIDGINENTVNCFADLVGHKNSGDNYVKVEINGLPQDLVSYTKSNDTIQVLLERKISSQRPVSVNVTGSPLQGMAAMTPISVPADVVLIGAESQISKVKMVRVDIDVAGVNADVTKKLPVRLLDDTGKAVPDVQIEPADQLIEVTVPIGNTKKVPINLAVQGAPAEAFVASSISVFPREVTIAGKPNVLDSVSAISTEALDITGAVSDMNNQVNLIMPVGVELVNKTELIKADIHIERIITKTISDLSVEFRNVNPKFVPETVTTPIQLTLRGPESLLANAAAYVKLYVDLRRGVEGTNTTDVMWEKPASIEVVDIAPPQLEVVLKKAE